MDRIHVIGIVFHVHGFAGAVPEIQKTVGHLRRIIVGSYARSDAVLVFLIYLDHLCGDAVRSLVLLNIIVELLPERIYFSLQSLILLLEILILFLRPVFAEGLGYLVKYTLRLGV